MKTARNSLAPLLLLAAPAAAQEVAPCDPVPPVTALVEPWEETSADLAEGAVRLAVIEDAAGAVALLVLTLPPPPEAAAEAEADGPPAPPPPPRTCRLVTEGGVGFAALDLGALGSEAVPDEALFRVRVPGLRFIPESSELEEVTLTLDFGVADDALAAAVTEGDAEAP